MRMRMRMRMVMVMCMALGGRVDGQGGAFAGEVVCEWIWIIVEEEGVVLL